MKEQPYGDQLSQRPRPAAGLPAKTVRLEHLGLARQFLSQFGYAWVGLGYITDSGQAMPAPDISSITALLAYNVPLDDTNPAPHAPAAVITGHCEVDSAYIRYGDLDFEQTNERLRELNIIVREGV